MTKKELLDELDERYERERKNILEMPDVFDSVSHTNCGTVFLEEMKWAEFVQARRKLSNWTVEGYYMCHTGESLAVSVKVEDSDYGYVFFVTDYEYALEQLSDGKCRVEEERVEKVTRNVICDMED